MIPLLAATPHLGGAVAPDVSPLRIALALAACLAIAALAIVLMRQRLGHGASGSMLRVWSASEPEIVVGEVRRIGIHGDMAIVRHAGREYLLLVQAGSAHVLRERGLPPPDAEPMR